MTYVELIDAWRKARDKYGVGSVQEIVAWRRMIDKRIRLYGR